MHFSFLQQECFRLSFYQSFTFIKAASFQSNPFSICKFVLSESVLCNGGVQLLYILRHSWAEDLYLNALDSKRANLGFYRMWTDMV